jgi:hypothetical protein
MMACSQVRFDACVEHDRFRLKRCNKLGALPLPNGERVGVRGFLTLVKSITPHPPAFAVASAGDLSPPNSGLPEFGT